MKHIRFYKLRYNNKKILLGYCDYKMFDWFCTKIKGTTILCINSNSSLKYKRKLLHKAIHEISG